MSIQTKRPFLINEDPKRSIIVKNICDFVREHSKETGSYVSEYSYRYKKFCFICPCCNKKYTFSACENYQEVEYKDGILTDLGSYWIGYYIIKGHLQKDIQTKGRKQSMDCIMKIFGRKLGREILILLVKRNILATKLICEYLKRLK